MKIQTILLILFLTNSTIILCQDKKTDNDGVPISVPGLPPEDTIRTGELDIRITIAKKIIDNSNPCSKVSRDKIWELMERFELNKSTIRKEVKLNEYDINYFDEQEAPGELIMLYFSVMDLLLDSIPNQFNNKGTLNIFIQRTIFALDSMGQLNKYFPPNSNNCTCPSFPKPSGNPIHIITKGPHELEIFQQDLNYVNYLIEKSDIIQQFEDLEPGSSKSDSLEYEHDLFDIALKLELRCVSLANLNMYYFRGDARAIMEKIEDSDSHLAILAAQKVILLAAQRSNFKIRDKGDLTHYAEQLVQVKKAKVLKNLIKR